MRFTLTCICLLTLFLCNISGSWVEASYNCCWFRMRSCFISWTLSCERESSYWVPPGIETFWSGLVGRFLLKPFWPLSDLTCDEVLFLCILGKAFCSAGLSQIAIDTIPLTWFSMYWLLQPLTEEVQKKEPTDRDVQEGFDITLTKHKGQVCIFLSPVLAIMFQIFWYITFYSSTVLAFNVLFVINSEFLISFTSCFNSMLFGNYTMKAPGLYVYYTHHQRVAHVGLWSQFSAR